MHRPKPTAGLHHVALLVENFSECEKFYVELVGMAIEWRPDADNLYLTSGNDNLALHRAPADFFPGQQQRLDHLGFFLNQREDVFTWHDYMLEQHVPIKAGPKDHRDGTSSFYCADPDGNVVQFIYYPLINKVE